MKKSVIAMAVAAAVAAPAAFADVTISGFVLQEFAFDDDTGANDDGIENHSDVGLVFTASEDLGNGMKAFAKIDRGTDTTNGANGTQNNDQIVGLSGSFGTIVAGRMEDFTEGKVAAMASVDSSDLVSVEPNGAHDTGRNNGAIAYVSPNMSGFQVGVAGYAVPGGTAGKKFDATDMMIGYSAGGITVRLARETVDTSVLNTGGTNKQKTTSIGAEYKTGPFRVVAVHQGVDNSNGTATDLDGWMIGGNYTMGNNKFGIGYMKDELTTTTENKRLVLDFTHNLSKRTKAYVTYQDNDAPAGTRDTSIWVVGMKHSF